MNEGLSERDLQTLFRKHAPSDPIPSELSQKIRNQVLTEVAISLRPPVEPKSRLQDWLDRFKQIQLQLEPSTALFMTGVATACFVLFVLMARYLIDPSLVRTATAHIQAGTVAVIRHRTGGIEEYASGAAIQLELGDQLITQSGSARIEFFDGQITQVQPGSKVEIESLASVNNSTEVVLIVHAGQTISDVRVALDADDRFEVHTVNSGTGNDATAVSVPSSSQGGNSFVVEVRPNSNAYVTTITGIVDVSSGIQSVEVTTNNEVTVVSGEELIVQQFEPIPTVIATPTIWALPTPTFGSTETIGSTETVRPTPTQIGPLVVVTIEVGTPTASATIAPVVIGTETAIAEPSPTATPTASPTLLLVTATSTSTPPIIVEPSATPQATTPQATNTPTAVTVVNPTEAPTSVPATSKPSSTNRPTATPTKVIVVIPTATWTPISGGGGGNGTTILPPTPAPTHQGGGTIPLPNSAP